MLNHIGGKHYSNSHIFDYTTFMKIMFNKVVILISTSHSGDVPGILL